MSQTIFFIKVKQGETFIFGEDVYIKTGKYKALKLSGSRIFNLYEIVKKEIIYA